jgi:hypothetical protein
MHDLTVFMKLFFPLLFPNRIKQYLFFEQAQAYSIPSPASLQWHFGVLSMPGYGLKHCFFSTNSMQLDIILD